MIWCWKTDNFECVGKESRACEVRDFLRAEIFSLRGEIKFL